MISAETMKWRLQEGRIAEFDLVFWKGTGRVVGAGDRLSLQVRGKRADYTWERVRDTWQRLQDNHELDRRRTGRRARRRRPRLAVRGLRAGRDRGRGGRWSAASARAAGRPVRPDPGAPLPPTWAPLQRKIDGN